MGSMGRMGLMGANKQFPRSVPPGLTHNSLGHLGLEARGYTQTADLRTARSAGRDRVKKEAESGWPESVENA